ncbi:MAG TPA: efflux RND transporter periplasmic adaptor subunit [bacterium]|nr:efflux RND transporter periplasmic adaptor subunit [bacterium]
MKKSTRNVLVSLALAAVVIGGWYGARAMSGFDAANATTDAASCEPHGLENCPFCDPSLLESMGFCQEHGVPEAICSRCRPDLERVFRDRNDWCAGHRVAESQCELCNPGTLDKFSKYDPTGGELPAVAPDIEVVLDDAPRVQRRPSATCDTENSTIRFASPDVAVRAGLEIQEVVRAPLRRMVSAPAELRYDATRHAMLASRASGYVVAVHKQLGDRVERGDVLLVVDSAELGTAKSELLQAAARVELWERNHAREEHLLQESLSTEKDVIEAGTNLTESRIALAVAEQKLRNLGLGDEKIEQVMAAGDTSTRLELVAPFDGVVVELRAVVGQPASSQPGNREGALISIADTSRIWVLADVEQSEVSRVAVGQDLLLNLDGSFGLTFAGKVTWISTEVDRRTRTVKVRAEIENGDGQLRAGMYGRVRIVTRAGEPALLVPKAAVQWEGCCNVAFVQRSRTEFAPRKLHLGYDTGDYYEVLSGLDEGDRVVTRGSFLLKTELKKSSIGAGCCEVEHLGK